MRKVFVSIFALLLLLGVSACGSDSKQSDRSVCVAKATRVRVDDTKCSNGSASDAGLFAWLWFSSSQSMPKVGDRSSGGSFTEEEDVTPGGVPVNGEDEDNPAPPANNDEENNAPPAEEEEPPVIIEDD